MTKTEYKKYLAGPEWRSKREEVMSSGGGYCNKCDIPRWLAEIAYDQDLHVHHLSYANLGNENPEDLQVLCRRCHEIETFGRSELRAPKRATCESCNDLHWDYRSELCRMCESIHGGYSTFGTVLSEAWRPVLARLAEMVDVGVVGKSEFVEIFERCVQSHQEHREAFLAALKESQS